MAHVCNPTPLETEAGGWEFAFELSLGNLVRHCLKIPNKKGPGFHSAKALEEEAWLAGRGLGSLL